MRGHAITFLVALLAGIPAGATEIYRWVDEDGVVHFSDTKPADEEVNVLYVGSTNPPGYEPAEDPYSIRNQADRINLTWSRLEDERDKRREVRREQAARRPLTVYAPYDPYDDAYHYSYYRPGFRPPFRPPHRPDNRPVRPLPVIRGQVTAMDELGLTGPRPHSINSGRHLARVESSADFLDLARNPPPRAVPLRQ